MKGFFRYSGFFEGHTDSVYCLAQGSTGTGTFYSGAGDGQVVAWQLNRPVGRLITRFPHSVYAMQFLPEWDALLVGHNYEGLHLLDVRQHRAMAACRISASALFAIGVYGHTAFVGSQQGDMYRLSLPDLKLLSAQKLAQGPLRSIAVCAKAKLLIVGSSDDHIYALKLPDGTLCAHIQANQKGVFSVCVLDSHKSNEVCRILSGGKNGQIRLFSLRLQGQLYAFHEEETSLMTHAHLRTIYALQYAKDLHLIAAGSRDKSISFWGLRPLERQPTPPPSTGHHASVNALCWMEDKQLLLSGSDDKRILQWNWEAEQKNPTP